MALSMVSPPDSTVVGLDSVWKDFALDIDAVQAETAAESALVLSNAATLSLTLPEAGATVVGGFVRCGVAEGNKGEIMTGLSRARLVVKGVMLGVSETFDRR